MPAPIDLDALIARQRDGYCLEQPFYLDREIYERDVERIYMRVWQCVGHVSQVPSPGDYFLFEVANESVIITRGDDGKVRALLNVCRHRGSRICDRAQGSVRTFACPYHGWVYDRAGELRSASALPEGFDKSAHGLRQIALRVFHGLILVCFADDPPDLEPAFAALDAPLAPFELADAKVAYREIYPIDANWKLAVENYDECYHCKPAHPEYARAHARQEAHGSRADLVDAMNARATEVGLVPAVISATAFDAPPGTEQFFFERYPLYEGLKSGSRDGEPLAPLLGRLTGFDGGASDLQIGPVSFALIYSDHAVLYRFTARDVLRTDCEITWLVRGDAVEGVDYDVERLKWMWDVTTIADKSIIDRNQAGVCSRFYEPGPYTEMEHYTRVFRDWYLATIR